MTKEEIYEALTTIFRDVFLRDDLVLSPELNAAAVIGWDSFKQVEIIMAVEEHYGISLTPREVDALKKVGDLVDTIARKTG